jgi:hypothetical protein
MVVIKTMMKDLPDDCSYCQWFGCRPHPAKGWSDLCELESHCLDDDQEEDWIYTGDGRVKACPLMEVPEVQEDLEKRAKDLKRDLSIQIARAENLDLMLNDYRNRAERAETRLRLGEEGER